MSPLSLPILIDDEDLSSPFKNRVRKNYRHVRKWAKRTETNCFRIYDRDIKEYPIAVDYYDGRFAIHYFMSGTDRENPREELHAEVERALTSLFAKEKSALYWRTHARREKMEQIEKSDESMEFFTVIEHGVKFKVNLRDYLDSGLFLDHRSTRQEVALLAKGKRLLNLFAYTSAFSVHAAHQGAAFCKSVDLSNTYTAWSRDNFVLNSLPLENNPILRKDCLKFLQEELLSNERYDIIVIDPPTLSRSKKMEQFFDIQVDYITLIQSALELLLPQGVIFFSTNSRKFRFDSTHFPHARIEEITERTIPLDFHNIKIHRCWKIYADHSRL